LLKRILPLALGVGVMAWFLGTLHLDWNALFRGDVNAGTSALRLAAESQGPMKGVALTAMIALLPLALVPISLILLTAAMVLPAPQAVAAIMLGTFFNTVLSYLAGKVWGRRAMQWMGMERSRFMQTLKDGVERHGLKMAVFSRCLPVPFIFPAVAAALVGLGFWQMVLGTAIMMLPWSVAYVMFTEALRRGDARYLGPALAALALLILALSLARRRRDGATAAPEGPLSPQVPALGPELTLYTLEGHEASQDARDELWRLRPRLGFEVREVSLGGDPALMALYQDTAPVVFLGERRIFSFQVDEHALENHLKAARD
jgi:uncharacterized membrane protein YdjX (TVP38/TMEM64 family)